jgi:hypothetical protein
MLRLLRLACFALRLDDIPRGRRRWYRMTLWLLEQRYTTAAALHGRTFARRYDYVPF